MLCKQCFQCNLPSVRTGSEHFARSKINKNETNVDLTLSTVKQFSSTSSTTMRAFEQSCHHNNHPVGSQPRTHAHTRTYTQKHSRKFFVVCCSFRTPAQHWESEEQTERERDKRSERQITEEDKRERER